MGVAWDKGYKHGCSITWSCSKDSRGSGTSGMMGSGYGFMSWTCGEARLFSVMACIMRWLRYPPPTEDQSNVLYTYLGHLHTCTIHLGLSYLLCYRSNVVEKLDAYQDKGPQSWSRPSWIPTRRD